MPTGSLQHYTPPPTGLAVEDFTARIKAADSPEERLKLLKEKQAALELIYPRKPAPERFTPTEAESLYTTRNGDDWRIILERKQAADRLRRGGLGRVKEQDVDRLRGLPPPRSQRPAKSAALRQTPPKIAKRVPAATGKKCNLHYLKPSKLTAQEPENLSLPGRSTTPEPEAVTVSYAHGVSMKTTLAQVCARPDLSSKTKLVALVLAAHAPTVQPSKQRLMQLTGLSRATVTRALVELRDKHLLSWKSGKSHQANLYLCCWLYAV